MQRAKSNINKEILKHKLTHGIDKDVIEKAKAAGIDISSITENLLKTMNYELKNNGDDDNNNGNTRHDVARAYEALFREAWLLLSKYEQIGSFDVKVGNWQYDWEKKTSTIICFNSHMGLAICYDVPGRPIQEPDISAERVLEAINEYGLEKILENLLLALTHAAETNKLIITEIKFASQVLNKLLNMFSNKEEEEDSKRTTTK
jgi:post-segregation antitoxin (ccd killing protein)